jgi:hypothetical protein
MPDDNDLLRELNIKIGDAENRGDKEWLISILAPRLAFQRADKIKTVDDKVAFLQKVAPGVERITRIIEPIVFYGNRAIVQWVVTIGAQEFHNLRLFVKREEQWKLLAWANEPV